MNNVKLQNGSTPLHFACKSGQVDTIVELIQLNANVEAQDNVCIHNCFIRCSYFKIYTYGLHIALISTHFSQLLYLKMN